MAYATSADLANFGVAAQATATIAEATRVAQLEAASKLADGYLRARVTLPLQAPYGADLVQAVCKIAAFELLRNRGLDPETEQDLARSRKESIEWLRDIASGTATPDWIDSSPDGAVGHEGSYVVAPGVDDCGNPVIDAPTSRGI